MNKRTVAALVAVALLAVAGATATGAFTAAAGPHEDLEATPGTGPNGEYASVVDGQIALDLGDRVNREGVTRFAGVFSLTYTGEESADVWLEDGSDAVTFTALSNPIEGDGNAVTLAPGESLSIGVSVDTTHEGDLSVDGVSLNARLAGDTGGAESVSVSQPEPGVVEFEAENVSAGDPVTVDTTGGNDAANASVDSLSVTTNEDSDLAMSVSSSDENGSAPAFTASDEGGDDTAEDASMGYINVSHELSDERIDGASFEFSVSKATLDDRGVASENVQLYRFHDGSWNGVSTAVVGESPEAFLFRADSPGLSVFAIGERTADDTDSGTDGSTGGDTGGDTSGDTGDTSDGDAPDLDDPTATPDDGTDTSTATQTTTPAPNGTETPTQTATATPDEGTPTSTAEPTATDTPTESGAAAPVEEPQGFAFDRVLAVLGLVALAGLVAYYRRRQA